MKFRLSLLYGILTVVLFVTEVFIALYIDDKFVRPYVGDFLVVMLLYCFVCTFIDAPVIPVALAVLAFSFIVETLQYFNIVEVLGVSHSRFANVVLGNYFTWSDIIAYTLGIALTIVVELCRRQPKKQPNVN